MHMNRLTRELFALNGNFMLRCDMIAGVRGVAVICVSVDGRSVAQATG